MAESVYEINVERFWHRLGLLHGHWQRHLQHSKSKSKINPYPGWNGCDSILILCGKSDDAEGYKRNNSMHIWLFGYELLSTIIIITKKVIYICAGTKTSLTLQQLVDTNGDNSHPLKIELITKNKNDGYVSNFEQLTAILADCGKKIGLIREEMKGFAEKFSSQICSSDQFEISSFGEALSDVTIIKDKFETLTIRKVSEFTSLALKHFQKTMEKLIERGKTKKHSEIANNLLKILENPKMIKSNLKNENLDVCYDPIIQSGGKYKLKPSAESNEDDLHYDYGTIVIMMGFRLRDYCSNIGRTFLIDASSEQKEIYNILVTVFKKGLLMLRDNTELHRIYEKCIATIKKSKRPYLTDHFLKSVGWGIGLEFRDKNYVINKKAKKQCKAGMIFNFQVGFEGLTDKTKEKRGLEKAKNYSVIIADTVLVTDDQPQFLTKFNRKFFDYELNGDLNEGSSSSPQKQSKSPKKKKRESHLDDQLLPPTDNPYRRVTRQSNRRSAMEQKEQLKARRERSKKQTLLRVERSKRLNDLLEETGGNLIDKKNENEWMDPRVYSDNLELPNNHHNKLMVDLRHEALICPVMDHFVPFHITTIKNFSISTTPDGTYLRINFLCPVSGKNKKQPMLYLKHPESHFIKELTYRNVSGGNNLQFVYQQLKELQKVWKANKKNKLLNKTMIKQDRLQRASSNKVLILKELSLKPSMGGRKRGTGRLEAHQNGFKYVDHKKNQCDVLFNNIKNALFQKSKNTPAVIIHFHLKNAILIAKKPTFHVQVYRDVIERFVELGRGRRSDYDGARAEQEEERRIRRTNNQFKQFCERVQEMAKDNGFNLEFDKPAMDLMMTGVPNKQSTHIYPTEHCLVALEDSPAFVIDTNDIEIAHFERVSYSLRNFDVVFVYKDLLKDPHRITTIPREHIDTLQEFLSWKNVLYSTGKINLDWKTLMNKIRTNLQGFVESGAWDFLLANDEFHNPNAGDDDDELEDNVPLEDQYNPEDDEDDDDYSDYSDEDDDDDDDYDDYDETDEDENGYDDASEEEEGLDWDELDKKAAAEDRRANQRENMDKKRERNQRRNQQYRSNNRISPNNKRRRY